MEYLTPDEYILRFGELETNRITSENGTGIDGAAKLQAAIDDAAAFADGYVSTKYTLPLASVPSTLARIVGDLAREMLHPNHPSQRVKEAADLARKQLLDIAAGRMTLPVAQGDTAPVERQAFAARTSRDARRPTFSDCALAGYVGLGRDC